MATVYRIRDWSKHFENNRSREVKRLAYVCLPNKMDGDGYSELMDHPNGVSHYGSWVALVAIASKCDTRGTLLRDTGEPHTIRSICRMCRVPSAIMVEAIERLIVIGWLEVMEIPQEGAVRVEHKPQDGAAPVAQESQASAAFTELKESESRTEGKGNRDGTAADAAGVSATDPSEESASVECELIAAWNGASGTVKNRGERLTDARRKHFRARLRSPPWEWRDALRKFPLKLCESDPNGWQPDMDWFLQPESVSRILEGKYDWRKGNSKGPRTNEQLLSGLQQFVEREHDAGAIRDVHGGLDSRD